MQFGFSNGCPLAQAMLTETFKSFQTKDQVRLSGQHPVSWILYRYFLVAMASIAMLRKLTPNATCPMPHAQCPIASNAHCHFNAYNQCHMPNAPNGHMELASVR